MDQLDTTVLFFVLPLAIILLVAVLAWRATRRAAHRTEALRRQSLLLGYSFSDTKLRLRGTDLSSIESSLEGALKTLQVFQKRSRGWISNLMSKTEDSQRSDWIFDFSYSTGSGNQRHTVRQSVIGVCFKDREFPSFTVQREGLFARLFDGADIDFEQDPDFSKRYLLKGAEAERVKRLFSPYVRSLLMGEKDWFVEAAGGCLVMFRPGHLIAPEDLLAARDEFRRLLDAMTVTS